MRLVIVGAGGHGSEVCAYVNRSRSELELLGFLDDHATEAPHGVAPLLGGLDQLPKIAAALRGEAFAYITAVGDNAARRRMVEQVEAFDLNRLLAATLVHDSAVIGQGVQIEAGTLIAPGAVLTAHVQIGRHCIVNVQASVSHDTVLEDFVNVNPGAVIAGNVVVEREAYIGAGATIIQRCRIGARSIVGAGAVVIGDVPPDVTVVGVPARVVQPHDDGDRA